MNIMIQPDMLNKTVDIVTTITPFKLQLLKWIGNKQRFAHEVIAYFPTNYNTYIEPFVGSGAILGSLAPKKAIAGDIFSPLIEIWNCLQTAPDLLCKWYEERYNIYALHGKAGYETIKLNYNTNPNGADLLFLCRSCYGGVVRFRKKDGYMSTPCGIHRPITPESFKKRVYVWRERVVNTCFINQSFEHVMDKAEAGDVIYCDPPYTYCQSILYGAQSFKLNKLIEKIEACKQRGVKVLLSIDGSKKSGKNQLTFNFPDGLFEREAFVNCGRSMLRRFQMDGDTLENEIVADRLLLTY